MPPDARTCFSRKRRLGSALGAAPILMCAAVWLPLLAGCASVEPAYLANGMKVVRIDCGLAVDGAAACYKAAGDICGRRGFALFDWDGKPWEHPYPDPASLEGDMLLQRSTSVLVACRS